MHQFLLREWQRHGVWAWLTSPLGGLVCLLAGLKRKLYTEAYLKQTRIATPLIVVGNLSVGGAGKTPLVGHLSKMLLKQGYRPGVLCRGYKGQARSWPQLATAQSDPQQVGDEPVMLAMQTGCPIMAGPDRAVSATRLIDQHHCNVIISDDGFQHLKLARDVDIVVIDGERGLGNGWCLPAGPLRESPSALGAADMLVIHGETSIHSSPLPAGTTSYTMRLKPGTPYPLSNAPAETLQQLNDSKLHAIAGIGHPQRFFMLLRKLEFDIIEHAFPDHHAYLETDLQFADTLPLITTEKDATKLAGIKTDRPIWVLPVVADLEAAFDAVILEKLR